MNTGVQDRSNPCCTSMDEYGRASTQPTKPCSSTRGVADSNHLVALLLPAGVSCVSLLAALCDLPPSHHPPPTTKPKPHHVPRPNTTRGVADSKSPGNAVASCFLRFLAGCSVGSSSSSCGCCCCCCSVVMVQVQNLIVLSVRGETRGRHQLLG